MDNIEEIFKEKFMKIYTKNGDKGKTRLLSGESVYKNNAWLNIYGEMDTLNCHIGHLASYLKDNSMLNNIQHKLFDFGALLACSPSDWKKFKLVKDLNEQIITDLENAMDEMDKKLPALSNFILPGGSIQASLAHICRAKTRSLEREFVGAFSHELNEHAEYSFILKYLNRLSDYFFVLARHANFCAQKEEIIYNNSFPKND